MAKIKIKDQFEHTNKSYIGKIIETNVEEKTSKRNKTFTVVTVKAEIDEEIAGNKPFIASSGSIFISGQGIQPNFLNCFLKPMGIALKEELDTDIIVNKQAYVILYDDYYIKTKDQNVYLNYYPKLYACVAKKELVSAYVRSAKDWSNQAEINARVRLQEIKETTLMEENNAILSNDSLPEIGENSSENLDDDDLPF